MSDGVSVRLREGTSVGVLNIAGAQDVGVPDSDTVTVVEFVLVGVCVIHAGSLLFMKSAA